MVNHAKSCVECGNSPVVAKDMCNIHYRRFKKTGDPNRTNFKRSKYHPGTEDHFKESTKYVDGPLDTQCLIWTKALTKSGYGLIGSKPLKYAHRFSYELYVGEVPKGYYVCHKCDNPSCCNPGHLFAGEPQSNHDDMINKGRDRKYTRLSDEEIREIRSSSLPQNELANKYSITKLYVNRIQQGKARKNV